MHQAIDELAHRVTALLIVKARELGLSQEQIVSIRPMVEVEPHAVPALGEICGPLPPACPATDAVCRAVQRAAPYLCWRRTYSEADGFPAAFLTRYGWFDLAGPDGPYGAEGLRIMIGYWGDGLFYPDHSHEQEEHYLVLAGSAWFRLGDEPLRRVDAGEVFHTPPGTVHAAEMRDEPLMALAIWRAQDLTVRVHLTDSDRSVEIG
ncbi:MAG: dimethylsulfonioproprionate lyase family protein [Pseudomonadota bacterium]